MLGSYVPELIGQEVLKSLLELQFPEVKELLACGRPPFSGYHDIDIRIEASSENAVKNFTAHLEQIFAHPLTDAKVYFQLDLIGAAPSLDVEKIKFGLIDLVYCRTAGQEQERTEQQSLRVDLHPYLLAGDSFRLLGSLQAILDLWCGIGHWVKQDNNKWDLCAYILMITRGIRFPDEKTEGMLKQIFLDEVGDHPGDLIDTLMDFNKVTDLTADAKALYALNAAMILQLKSEQLQELLPRLKPSSPLLKGLIDLLLEGHLDYAAASSMLQVLSLRLLTMPSEKEAFLSK